MPAFHPGGGVSDQREGGGMAFRKAVTAEALKLFESLLRKFLRVAILHHAGDQLLCHLVSFNLMANKPKLMAVLTLSLNNITYAGDSAAKNPDPECINNYANAENLLTKVDPEAFGPAFVPIPIRIVISADGSVKDVHVIRATVEQRNSIE